MNATQIKTQNTAVAMLREIQKTLQRAEAAELDSKINWTLKGQSLALDIQAKTVQYR